MSPTRFSYVRNSFNLGCPHMKGPEDHWAGLRNPSTHIPPCEMEVLAQWVWRPEALLFQREPGPRVAPHP